MPGELTVAAAPSSFTRWAKLGPLVILGIYGISCLRHPQVGHLIDGVDLAIHETGHLVFRPFGEVIQFMGGTLFQLIVPVMFLVYFVKFAPKRDDFAASVMLWWVAVNLWNISVYMADARAQVLPLVGGGEHDWAYLFGRAGWLAHDTGIARGVQALGVLVFGVAIICGYLAAMTPKPVEAVDEVADAQ